MCLRRINGLFKSVHTFFVILGVLLFSAPLYASPRMPWDDGLTVILNSLTGTTAHTIVIIAIAVSGIMLAYGEHGSLMQTGGRIIIGGSIAVGAVSIYSTLFNML